MRRLLASGPRHACRRTVAGVASLRLFRKQHGQQLGDRSPRVPSGRCGPAGWGGRCAGSGQRQQECGNAHLFPAGHARSSGGRRRGHGRRGGASAGSGARARRRAGRHRDGSAAVRLRRVECPAREALGDAHAAGAPVDVAPAQGKELALAQTGHGRGQVERALEGAEGIGGHRAPDGLELLGLQDANPAWAERCARGRSTSATGFVVAHVRGRRTRRPRGGS